MSVAFTDVTDTAAVNMAASKLVEIVTVTLASSGQESNSDNMHIQLPNRLATVKTTTVLPMDLQILWNV